MVVVESVMGARVFASSIAGGPVWVHAAAWAEAREIRGDARNLVF